MLDFLTRETFKLSGRELNEVYGDNFKHDRPSSPGLLYFVEKGRGTFSLRAIVSSNIKESLSAIDLQGVTGLYSYTHPETLESHDFKFFETDTVERAEVLLEQLANKRIPYEEQSICNLSDPGYSWWLRDDGDRLKIYFRSYGLDVSADLSLLGPIGDSHLLLKRFNQLLPSFDRHFEVKEFSHTLAYCTLVTSPQDQEKESFVLLKALFKSGDASFVSKYLSHLPRSIQLYFEELATIRRFWITIESTLGKERERLLQ